jgi:hypothetical protein
MVSHSKERSARPITRVVRTDFYLERGFYLERRSISEKDNFEGISISVAFLKNKRQKRMSSGDSQATELTFVPKAETRDPLAALVTLFEQQANRAQIIPRAGESRYFVDEAKYILAESIVVERSPPLAEALSHLLQGSTITIGELIGTGATSHPVIAFVVVPAGILIMGAVLGISRGLERGLSKLVEARLTQHLRPARRHARPAPKARPRNRAR